MGDGDVRPDVPVGLAELAAGDVYAWQDHVPFCPLCAAPMLLMELKIGNETGLIHDAVRVSYYCPPCRAGIVLGRNVSPL